VPDHLEIERTYAAGPKDQLPDLTALPAVVRAVAVEPIDLRATYLDTHDLALTRAGVSLRRRSGGSDDGWHLKIPSGDGRSEIRRPPGRSDAVPAVLADAVTGWTWGRALGPVATVETRRTETRLLDQDGAVLAEVADDVVLGTPVDAGAATAWREIEVELGTAGLDLLDAADELFSSCGIEPSRVQRKIEVVLAERLGSWPAPKKLAPGRPGVRVVQHRLSALVAELALRDSEVRRRVPDGVHQLRVTCRRLRALLATFRPLLEQDRTEPVREELRWLARTLGGGRDVEVVRDRLTQALDGLPRSQVVGPVRRRIGRVCRDDLRQAEIHAVTVLRSRRYLRLLARLDVLVSMPAWTDAADQPATEVLLGPVAQDWRRLRRRVELALDALDDEARDEALHDVRKAAKRLRYACETLEPVWGDDARALRKAAQQITQVLGERQDGAVARGHLRRIAASATAAGESSFTYGVLHAREEQRGPELEAEFVTLWDQVRRSSLRAWL